MAYLLHIRLCMKYILKFTFIYNKQSFIFYIVKQNNMVGMCHAYD
jgi:hypothetical protein